MMAGSVKAIDRQSVHRICSGQVVLNLATAVKELVENALDAGATNIDIRLKEYGSEILEVTDNGSGVEETNFQGLTLKHHTSKLRDFSDLSSVDTFGFRGEALSSLCALSDMTVMTCHESVSVGTRLEYDHNGELIKQMPCPRQHGTTVTLQNLFSTLPVRHKEFLRNLKKEFSKMVQLLQAYGIISSGVKLTCTNQVGQGKRSPVLSTSGNSTLKENIANVFGPKQLQSLLGFSQASPNTEQCEEYGLTEQQLQDRLFKLTGYVSKSDHGQGRSSADRQYYYVNKRPCDFPKVSKLMNEVYHMYNRHQYPFVVLDISLAKDSVDVNVTPDKRKIFVLEEKSLLAMLKASLQLMFEPRSNLYDVNSQMKKSSGTSSGKTETGGMLSLFARSSLSSGSSAAGSKPDYKGLKVTLAGLKRSFSNTGSSVDNNSNEETEARASKQPRLDAFLLKRSNTEPANHPSSVAQNQASDDIKNIVSRASGDSSSLLEEGDASSEPLVEVDKDAGGIEIAHDDYAVTSVARTSSNEYSPTSSTPDVSVDQDESAELASSIETNAKGCLTDSVKKQLPQLQSNSKSEGCVLGSGHKSEECVLGSGHKSEECILCSGHKSEECVLGSGHKSEECVLGSGHKSEECILGSGHKSEECTLGSGHKSDGCILGSGHKSDDDAEKLSEKVLSLEDTMADERRNTEASSSNERGSSCALNGAISPTSAEESAAVAMETVRVERTACDGGRSQTTILTMDDSGFQPDTSRRREVTLPFSMDVLSKSLKEKQDWECSPRGLSRTFKAGITPSDNSTAEEELTKHVSKDMFPRMEILGQFNLGFIIAKHNRDLFIIDQHATDEKYNFEMLQSHTVLQGQRLIQAMPLELTAVSESILIENLEIFQKNGFDFSIDEEAPPTKRVKLMSLPMSKNWTFGKEDIDEVIFMLSDCPGVMCRPSRVRQMFASRSCRKSIMIGTALDKREMRKLVNHMADIDQPWNCPHGRPTMRHLFNLDMLPD